MKKKKNGDQVVVLGMERVHWKNEYRINLFFIFRSENFSYLIQEKIKEENLYVVSGKWVRLECCLLAMAFPFVF